MNTGFFDSFTVISIFSAMVFLILVSFEIGYRISCSTRSRYDKNASASLGPMVAGLLGMLGLVLAFTFSMAASHQNNRKHFVVDEANAVGTAYLRADFLEENQAAELKKLLKEYVEVRLWAIQENKLDEGISRSVEIHQLLWDQVRSAAKSLPGTNMMLVVAPINRVIELHEKRLTAGLHNRIPNSIWIVLFAISSFSMMTLGAQVAYTGKRRLVAFLPLTMAFGVLFTVVVDIDRPQKGLITVSQYALVDIQAKMK